MRMDKIACGMVLLLATAVSLPIASLAVKGPAQKTLDNCRVEQVAADGTSLDVVVVTVAGPSAGPPAGTPAKTAARTPATTNDERHHLLVRDPNVQAQLKTVHAGDMLKLSYSVDLKAQWILDGFSVLPATPASEPASETRLDQCRVEAVAADGMSLDVTACKSEAQDVQAMHYHILVRDTGLQGRVKTVHKGDVLRIVSSTDAKQAAGSSGPAPMVLSVFSVDTVPPSLSPVTALLGSGLVCFLLYCLLSGFHPLRLIIGEDGRYSNSKFQVALWFGVLIATYLATLWLRASTLGGDFLGGISIPTHLLTLSGMSAFTFGAAKAVTTSKVNDAIAKGIPDPKNSANAVPSFLSDLTHSDGHTPAAAQAIAAAAAHPVPAALYRGADLPPLPLVPPAAPLPDAPAVAAPPLDPNDRGAAEAYRAKVAAVAAMPRLDLGDTQMIVVTLLAVGVYLALVVNFLGTLEKVANVTLPDVDTTILAAFGLGHGAYLAKKVGGNVGQS